MTNGNQFVRFAKAFFYRLMRGEIKNTFYLIYYYIYLFIYDISNGTKFANSQKPEEGGVPRWGTGNFPAHPRIVELLIKNSNILKESKIIDIGSGSGVVLHVAGKMGYVNLTGVEYSKIAFNLSRMNLKNKTVKIINGDALGVDLSKFDVIFFFNPFCGDLAVEFFKKTPSSIKKIIMVNHDREIEPILNGMGFKEVFSYEHKIYQNFNGKVLER